MAVIFISPHFPEQFYHFCDRLKRLGANVLGVGDCPYDGLSGQCRDALTEYYYVPSLEDYESVYRAVAASSTSSSSGWTKPSGVWANPATSWGWRSICAPPAATSRTR